jgi:hypothetical protein
MIGPSYLGVSFVAPGEDWSYQRLVRVLNGLETLTVKDMAPPRSEERPSTYTDFYTLSRLASCQLIVSSVTAVTIADV